MHISKRTQLCRLYSNVKSILFYGAETWRTTKAATNKMQTFPNRHLRPILRIYRRAHHHKTRQKTTEMQTKHKKWGWIGHILTKRPFNITKQALFWNQQGKKENQEGPGTPGEGLLRHNRRNQEHIGRKQSEEPAEETSWKLPKAHKRFKLSKTLYVMSVTCERLCLSLPQAAMPQNHA